ncbi:TPA: hypothetical protein N0F65_002945 [Lagenidium giganteum]|uniref:Uncharacterized protein n=1 Tax=Lagenidium giganteum TaxID=4803 RepID=A0AAV2Z8Y0_9STRA|nr:TPA: hypothetical protein N0F65_002945 [Lagenidium giganteum]
MKHLVFHLYRNENAPSRAYLAYSSLAVEAIMNACYQVGSADTSPEFAFMVRQRDREVSASRPRHQRVLYESTQRKERQRCHNACSVACRGHSSVVRNPELISSVNPAFEDFSSN